MQFYNFPWGLYPRRVQIYLKEKGLSIDTKDLDPSQPGWPPQELVAVHPLAKLPVLVTPENNILTQSLGIIRYLEAAFPDNTLSGRTPFEIGKVAELVSLADEVTIAFGFWVHNASPLFQDREDQSLEAAKTGAIWFLRKLAQLEDKLVATELFLVENEVSIADCVLMPILQFSREFYGVELPDVFPKMKVWFDRFYQRESVARHSYPVEIHELAKELSAQSGFTLADLDLGSGFSASKN